jgi:hypothetical protein
MGWMPSEGEAVGAGTADKDEPSSDEGTIRDVIPVTVTGAPFVVDGCVGI